MSAGDDPQEDRQQDEGCRDRQTPAEAILESARKGLRDGTRLEMSGGERY